jgi:hypothetical protein
MLSWLGFATMLPGSKFGLVEFASFAEERFANERATQVWLRNCDDCVLVSLQLGAPSIHVSLGGKGTNIRTVR